jgi:DNA-binding transcriptional MocR family regulator
MDSKNFIAQVEFAMRRRLKTPYGRLTGNHVLVSRRLAFSQARTPSHRLLALRTGLSTKTVQRAFKILHALGLLTWTRRVVYIVGARRQISNAYTLLSSKPLSFLGIKSSVKLSTCLRPAPAAAAVRADFQAVRAKNAAILLASLRCNAAMSA